MGVPAKVCASLLCPQFDVTRFKRATVEATAREGPTVDERARRLARCPGCLPTYSVEVTVTDNDVTRQRHGRGHQLGACVRHGRSLIGGSSSRPPRRFLRPGPSRLARLRPLCLGSRALPSCTTSGSLFHTDP